MNVYDEVNNLAQALKECLEYKEYKEVKDKVKSVPEKIKLLHFPVIIRPSYVIGGSKMKVCYNYAELQEYLKPLKYKDKVYIDEFIKGNEAEIDLVADKFGNTFIPLIAEHIEEAGVHSGDSSVLYPQRNLSKLQQEKMIKYTNLIAKKLKVVNTTVSNRLDAAIEQLRKWFHCLDDNNDTNGTDDTNDNNDNNNDNNGNDNDS